MSRSPCWILGTVLAACAGAPPPPAQDPETAVAQAELALREDRPADALMLLSPLEIQQLPRPLRDRCELAQAQALFLTGQVWDAYRIAEHFPDRYPHSERRAAIGELEWRIGAALKQRDDGFLFFWSDRRAARVVLEHLITRHPDHNRVPDALRLLGDMALEDQDYLLAQERFRDLMRRYPDSEWVVYARFRYAMSIVEGLMGPEYDLDQMQHACRELRDFLASNPENPDFVATASAALERLLEWRALRHVHIADFYARVDNPPGERLHLEYACVEELAHTKAGITARARLDKLLATSATDGEER